MRFSYTVEVEVERVQGKFASRDEIGELILEQLQGADIDVSGVGADGDSEYEVVSFDVNEEVR